MKRGVLLVVCAVLLFAGSVRGEDEPRIFSGPQVGEKLVGFQVRGVYGDAEGKKFDVVSDSQGRPMLLVFVHKRTRPSIATARALMKFVEMRKKDKLFGAVVLLTDDLTATAAWTKRARRALPQNVPIGISVDGLEGPGAYGLNRKVTLTVLVARDGKVAANFPLVQPSLQADAPRVLASVVKLIGGKVPTLAQLGVRKRRPAAGRGLSPRVQGLLRRMIQKTATKDEVETVAKQIEAEIAKDKATAKRVGQIGRRIIDAGRLKTYGTPPAQAFLKRWADRYAPAGSQPKKTQPKKPATKKPAAR